MIINYKYVFWRKRSHQNRRKIFARTTTVDTTMSKAMNCFTAAFTGITSKPIMSIILYILSEYVWQKPNNYKKTEKRFS